MHIIGCCGATVLMFLATTAAGVVRLEPQADSATETGEATQVCVSLNGGGASVGATEHVLSYDGACAELPSASDCEIIAGPGRDNLEAIFFPRSDVAYEVLVQTEDGPVEPIPGGDLYCCTFIAQAAPGQCCEVTVEEVSATDLEGDPLAAQGGSTQLCVDASGADDDACQVAPPRRSAVELLVAGAALWLVARRRRVV